MYDLLAMTLGEMSKNEVSVYVCVCVYVCGSMFLLCMCCSVRNSQQFSALPSRRRKYKS